MDEKKRDMRDQLLDPLLEHMHDVNAFVRSKALQLWHKMCLRQAIPLNLQHRVLSLTTGRLNDKSIAASFITVEREFFGTPIFMPIVTTAQVRKNAVQLLTALMQGNPYASRLPLKQLETQLEKEQAKLDELIKEK